MRFLFAPAMAVLRPMSNEVKLPFLAGLFLLPNLPGLLFERSPAMQAVAAGLYLFACYFTVAHYLQVQVMWGFLLGHLREIGRGKLVDARGEGKVGGQFLQGHHSIQLVVRNLRSLTGDAYSGAQRIRVAAGEIAARNSDLAHRTEQQASTLEEISAAMEELSATVKQNAANCVGARGVANNASELTTGGQEMVRQVAGKAAAIDASSRKVAQIVSVIEGIAFQTSILALNAAVEAANAGGAGRGFAVVAGEVRNLAQKSADAAKQIKGVIGASVASVEEGSRLVAQTAAMMTRLVESVREVDGRIKEIAAASEEQSTGVDELGRALAVLGGMTQENAAVVDRVSSAAFAFEVEAEKLEETVGAFRGDGDLTISPSAPVTSPMPAIPVQPLLLAPVPMAMRKFKVPT